MQFAKHIGDRPARSVGPLRVHMVATSPARLMPPARYIVEPVAAGHWPEILNLVITACALKQWAESASVAP
jgi:hypothetical protein